MILDYFEITNFRCYRFPTRFNFLPPERDRKVYVIGGLNGHGKSAFQQALRICLFGYDGQLRALHADVNRKNAEIGNNEIRLELQFREGKTVCRITRRFYTTGYGDKTVNQELTVTIDGHALNDDEAQGAIEQIFPKDVADFFLFDGEQIKELADKTEEETSEQLKESVETILGLRVLRTLNQDLTTVQNRLAEEGAPGTHSKLRDLEQELDKLDKAEAGLKKEHAEVHGELKELKKKIEAKGSEQREILEDIENYHHMRDRLARLQAQEQQLYEQIKTAAADHLPYALVARYLDSFLMGLSEQQHDEALTEYRRIVQENMDRLLQYLGDEGVCLCNRSLSTQSLHRVRDILAEYLLPRPPADSPAQDISMPQVMIQSLRGSEVEELRSDLRRAWSCPNVAELCQKWQNVIESIERTKREMEDYPDITDRTKTIEEISNLLSEYNNRKGQLETRLTAIRKQLEEIPQERQRVNVEMEELRARLIQSERSRKAARLIDKAKGVVEELLQEMRKEKIDCLEKHVTETFRRIWRKGHMLQKVSIDRDTFAVTIHQTDGRTINKQRLSAGEKELFALSLLNGLSRCASSSLPIIVDTPLSRLDSEHRENIVRSYYPHAAEQVILLSTDTELTPELYRVLLPSIRQVMTLEHDAITSSTTVRDGFFDFQHGGALEWP